jgi:hypothetical protein
VHRGNVLKGQGLLHEAVHAYSSAITMGGGMNALAYNNLGGSLQALGWSQLTNPCPCPCPCP